MKFGICTDPMNVDVLEQMGYDYLECAIAPLAAMEDGAFEAARAKVAASSIRCEAGNVLLPGTCRITGEEADHAAAREHLLRAIPRFAALGGQVAVFGSGGARNVPEGFRAQSAMEQLAAFCRVAGDLCAQYGVRVAIEPLNRKECNVLNSVAEGLELARMAAHDNVGVLADWYHVCVENEGVQGILDAGSMLWHCHIARPDGRAYPRPDDPAGAGYCDFFGALRAIGYAGRVSVEGGGDPGKDGPAALEVLRAYAG